MARKQIKHSVFINCPFDEGYRQLFQSLIFTLIYLEFKPEFSIVASSDHIRITRIMKLIENARFSIHDLSRNRASAPGEVARFNMPFELGLAIGCKRYGGQKHKHKRILILDKEKNAYDQSIGDISGQDIEALENDPITMMIKVRDWFARIYNGRSFVGGMTIWYAYSQFINDLPGMLKEIFTSDEIKNLQMTDFRRYATKWILEIKAS